MAIFDRNLSHYDNTLGILDYLVRQGLGEYGKHLEQAEYVFSERDDDHGHSVFDVVARFPQRKERWPRFLYGHVAAAMREQVMDDAEVWGVQFAFFEPDVGRHQTLYIDRPPEYGPGVNNCHFKQGKTILHDELRFRSPGEVAVYDVLKSRSILFFPNAAAVFGSPQLAAGVRPDVLEPDFLVCHGGRWGILEVNGDAFHSGPVKTAKDHDRARRFQHHGLFFVQAYDAERCRTDAAGVVDEFLRLLAASGR